MLRFILLMILAAALSSCGEVSFPEPDGPYTVGTTLVDITDESRPAYPGDKNRDGYRFSAYVWYPAASTNGSSKAPAMEKDLIRAISKYQGTPAFLMDANEMVEAWTDAPALSGKGDFPVIIFNHGAHSFARQNQVQMIRLASRGYIVLALSHPGQSLLTRYSDGHTITLDEKLYSKMAQFQKKNIRLFSKQLNGLIRIAKSAKQNEDRLQALKDLATLEYYQDMRKMMLPNMENTRYLIYHLGEVKTKTGLPMDTRNIALIGHSMGAVISGELAMSELPGVRAIVHLDAPQFTFNDQPQALQYPVLFMYSTHMKIDRLNINLQGVNQYYVDTAQAPCVQIAIEGTGHMSYSDLTYVAPLKFTGLIGPGDGNKTGKIVSDYCLAYLDQELKGKKSTLWEQVPAEWPEVNIVQK